MQSFVSLLLKIKVMIDHCIEDFSNSFKLLFLVSELGIKSPRDLCNMLNMAKSNLAILANKLKKDDFLIQEKSLTNKKEIFYKVTQLGKLTLDKKIEEIKLDNAAKKELISELKLLLSK